MMKMIFKIQITSNYMRVKLKMKMKERKSL